MTTPDVHTLTGAYAADALSPDEREAFEEHLAVCASCAQEAQELRETAGRLTSATAVSPPAQLRQRVMAEVTRTRQAPPPSHGRDRNLPGARRPSRPPWFLAAVACLAATVVGLAGLSAVLYQDLRQTRRSTDQVNAVLTAADAKTAVATSTAGRATVVYSRQQDRLAFLPAGLPKAPANRTYQLWLLNPGDPRSAGILGTHPDRATLVRQDTADVNAVAVTVEPAGGSPRPTTTPVIVVKLSNA